MANETTNTSPPTALRKLTPTCMLPGGNVMRRFSASEAQRLRHIVVGVLECVYTTSFSRAGAEKRFGPKAADRERVALRARSPHARPVPARRRGLSRDEESDLFLGYNYCRHRMMRILKSFGSQRLTAKAAREILYWDAAALDYRNRIVNANLGLVPSMVERSRLVGVDFAELISEGQLAMLRAADKFDCSRGFKFSTYACRAILTSVSRAVALMSRHRARFPTEYDPDLQKSDLVEKQREDLDTACVRELSVILSENTADLTDTEQRVLVERFGMSPSNTKADVAPKTLRQVAEVFGVTKERVRQIQNRALAKLRGVLDEEVFVA